MAGLAPGRRQPDSTRETTAPRGERAIATSELCPEADSKNLGLVETFLPDRIGKVKSDRADRGLPRHPDTGAQANGRALFDLRLDPPGLRQLGWSQHDIRRLDLVQCTKIGKHAPAQPELLGQPERHTQGDRAEIIFLAAQSIAADRIARSDAGALKAAQIVSADKEPILKQHLLAVPTKDIAHLAGQAQHPFRRDRIVIAEIRLIAHVIHAKADAGKVVADRSVIAARWIEPIIAAIV